MDPNQNRIDILTYQGVPFSDAITLTDAAGSVYPLADKTVTASIWSGSPESPGSLALAVTEGLGLISRNSGTGVITRTLTAAAMKNLAVGDYWYEIVVWDSTGTVIVDRPQWGFVQHCPCPAGSS